jgi:hypothetical protein
MSRRFQFSLRALLVATAFMSLLLGLTYVVPNEIGIPALSLLTIELVAACVAVTVYGSGYARSFCIGALVPLAYSMWHHMGSPGFNLKTFSTRPDNLGRDFYDTWQGELGICIPIGISTGLLSMAIYRRLNCRKAANSGVELE